MIELIQATAEPHLSETREHETGRPFRRGVSMRLTRASLLCLVLLFPFVFRMEGDTSRSKERWSEAARQDSLEQAVRTAMARMTTPELEQRRARRRLLQQEGYVSVLAEALRSDGLQALITYTRVSLQLEYSLPRNTLFVYVPVRQPPGRDTTGTHFYSYHSGPFAVPLYEDRSFPEDPWKK
jgi:hypothetical protein